MADRIIAWPDVVAGATQEQIEKLRVDNFLGRNVVGYASAQKWIEINGTEPPHDYAPRFWRDNSLDWGNDAAIYYAMPVRQAGKLVGISPVPTGYSAQDETFNFLGATVRQFCRQNAAKIGKIAKLKLVRLSAHAAFYGLSFAPGVPIDFPVGILISDPEGPIEVRQRGDGSIWAGPSSGPNEANLRSAGPLDGNWFPRINDAGTIEYCNIYAF